MATKKRIWYEGAIYHVTARGSHRNEIFRDEDDFKTYLNLLKEALEYYEEFNYKIICYCLMGNHIHLLLKTGSQPLGNFVSRVNSIYAKGFNKKYEYTGHLFQDRYFSELIKDDVQLLEASRYVHLNPVKANIVSKPERYRWSSYAVFIGKSESGITNSEVILEYFKHRNKHKGYKEFVEQRII